MPKSEAYHLAAIQYNEGLAKAAEELAPQLPADEDPKKWCIAVGKQHRFHAKRHRLALNKLRLKEEVPPVERIPEGLDVPEPVNDPPTTTEAAGQAEVTSTFSDGCNESHKPLENENCQYSPKNLGTDVNG